MNKVNKVIGKLRHQTQKAASLAAASRRATKQAAGAVELNHILNATVVEQNERMETLAHNCQHYRQKQADLQDKVSELEDRNGELYAQVVEGHNAIEAATCRAVRAESVLAHEQQEFRALMATERRTSDIKLKEAQAALRMSRLACIVLTLATVWAVASPYILPLIR